MTTEIQQLKEDIAILQEKLQKLEEQDPEMLLLRQGNIDIVDYDGKKYFRIEYTDSFADAYSWYVRKVGEDAIRPVRDVNVYAPLEELYQKEVVKQKDDYPYNPHKKYTPEETAQSLKETAQSLKEAFVKPQGPQGPVGPVPGPKGVIVGYEPTPQEPEDNEWTIEKLQEKNWYVDTKTLLKSNWEPKPKTPEETEKSLREAFQKVQQTEKWKETQRKIDSPKESWMNKSDEELVAILKKNPPKCLEFQLGKSLEDRIYKWWETCFVHHPEWSMEECVEDLLDIIELYLPRFQSAAGSQSLGVEDMVEGFNDCLNKIKSKLRNKKDT